MSGCCSSRSAFLPGLLHAVVPSPQAFCRDLPAGNHTPTPGCLGCFPAEAERSVQRSGGRPRRPGAPSATALRLARRRRSRSAMDHQPKFFENLSGAGKAIAVLTSGGDAQGSGSRRLLREHGEDEGEGEQGELWARGGAGQQQERARSPPRAV